MVLAFIQVDFSIFVQNYDLLNFPFKLSFFDLKHYWRYWLILRFKAKQTATKSANSCYRMSTKRTTAKQQKTDISSLKRILRHKQQLRNRPCIVNIQYYWTFVYFVGIFHCG